MGTVFYIRLSLRTTTFSLELINDFFFTVRKVVAARSCFYNCLSFCSPLGRHPPGRHPPGQTSLVRHPRADTPTPREMATAADGTHHTGMYSCCDIIFLAHIYRPLTKLREGNVSSHSVPPYPLLALTHSPEASESEVRASENFDPLAPWG